MRHNRFFDKNNILILIGLLFLLFSFGLFLFNMNQDKRARNNANDAMKYLLNETKEQMITNKNEWMYSKFNMPTVEYKGNRYIGIIEIPSVHLTLPIMDELDDNKLLITACRYQGSLYQNDLIIGGHNYLSQFAKLYKAKEGDYVRFIDVKGNVFTYTVDYVENVSGDDKNSMISGDWDLTLFTCTYSMSERHTLRCKRINN